MFRLFNTNPGIGAEMFSRIWVLSKWIGISRAGTLSGMDAYSLANPQPQIDILEQTGNAITLMELQVPTAFREALTAAVFPGAQLEQALGRITNSLEAIIDNLSHPSLRAVRTEADALFDVLEKACAEISALDSAAGHSHSFQVLIEDNLGQSAQEIVRICGRLAQSVRLAIDAFSDPDAPPRREPSTDFVTRFLDQYQQDLDRRFPSTCEDRIFDRNAQNLAIALIPGVGLAAEVLSAQGRFARAMANNDDELLDSARRELVSVVLIPCLGLAFNGSSSIIDTALKVGSLLSLLRVVTNDTPFETDFLGPISGFLLRIPGISTAVDVVLESSVPALAREMALMHTEFNEAFAKRFSQMP